MILTWTRSHALTAAGAVLAASLATATTEATAKTPGKTYCFHGHCHTVKTLSETQALVGKTQVIKASFYDDPGNDRYNPSNITSSGAYFRSDKADNAASPILPDGTKAVVWNPRTKKAAMIRINNAGPYWGDRKLDLSRAAAEKIGITSGGVGTVHLRVVEAPSKSEATYQRGRTYAPVRGFLGVFADLDAALVNIGKAIIGAPTATKVAADTPAKSKSAPASKTAVKVAETDVSASTTKAAATTPKVSTVATTASASVGTKVAVKNVKTAPTLAAKTAVSPMESLVRIAEREAEKMASSVRRSAKS
jgi:rare lipoprotein A